MAMTAGSVALDPQGGETKSGLAGAIFDELKTQTIAAFGVSALGTQKFADKIGLAITANAVASAVVAHITANAQARVKTTDSGVQRTPSPNDPNTNCQGPSADKLLSIE